jgi:hypothetical protein
METYLKRQILRDKFYMLLQDTATTWSQGLLLSQNMRPCGVKKCQPLFHSHQNYSFFGLHRPVIEINEDTTLRRQDHTLQAKE